MATPRGAEHRDLEQRLRNIEQALQTLTSAALRREQLGVTQGDFVVSGGGGVYLRDGGELQSDYPAKFGGGPAVQFGPSAVGTGVESYRLAILDESGAQVFYAVRTPYNPEYPANEGSLVKADAEQVLLDGAETTQLTGDAGRVMVLLDLNGLRLDGGANGTTVDGGPLTYLNPPTTGAGANVNWASTGKLRVVTSTQRDKYDVHPIASDEDPHGTDPRDLLALVPVWYKRHDEADQPEPHEYAGTIAEWAHEAGLHAWVSYDEDGQPWSFDYPGWTMALQVIVRWLTERADQSENRVAELESTVADLTRRLEALEATA